MKRFIQPMAPGWFASVMGTAVTSLAFSLLSARHADVVFLRLLADVFHWTAIALMIGLTVPALLRIAIYPKAVVQTLKHPIESSFYATFPIAMLVMSGQWYVRGLPYETVAALWWTGIALTFVTSYVVLFNLFTTERLKLGMVTPAHFIPAVGLGVIPVAGAALAAGAEGAMREAYFAVNMFGFGASIFMYVGLLAVSMARQLLGPAIDGKMTPTLMVHLAPLAILPLSLLSLLSTNGDESAIRYGTLVACIFLGAAFWWLILASALIVRNIVRRSLPFALSWWAFVFPIGALTVLSLTLSSRLNLILLPYVATALCTVLCGMWCVAAVGTVRAVLKGQLFSASPS